MTEKRKAAWEKSECKFIEIEKLNQVRRNEVNWTRARISRDLERQRVAWNDLFVKKVDKIYSRTFPLSTAHKGWRRERNHLKKKEEQEQE